MFSPSGLRLGVQNSKASTPMSSGGVCTPVLDTALLPAWKSDNKPVSLVSDKYAETASFFLNIINAYWLSEKFVFHSNSIQLRPGTSDNTTSSKIRSGV